MGSMLSTQCLTAVDVLLASIIDWLNAANMAVVTQALQILPVGHGPQEALGANATMSSSWSHLLVSNAPILAPICWNEGRFISGTVVCGEVRHNRALCLQLTLSEAYKQSDRHGNKSANIAWRACV